MKEELIQRYIDIRNEIDKQHACGDVIEWNKMYRLLEEVHNNALKMVEDSVFEIREDVRNDVGIQYLSTYDEIINNINKLKI